MKDTSTFEVYVKTNEDNIIIAINSSAFLLSTIGWIKIDEGAGDKYCHAQNYYLDQSITDNDGICNYKLIGNKPVSRTDEDKSAEREQLVAEREIFDLKRRLAETDYIAAKIAEGAATVEEYTDKLTERASWRARINELETTL